MLDRETTLITSTSTGFIGRELLEYLLAAQPHVRVRVLVRAADESALAARREALLAPLARAASARVDVLWGDMTAPRLGCDVGGWHRLVGEVDRVIHWNASTRFDRSPRGRAAGAGRQHQKRPRPLSRGACARRKRPSRLREHRGFVAGRRDGVAGEEELDVGQGFRNTYERTKLEAEVLCRDARGDVPVAIYRPSIVVGRQKSGETTSYKAAYGPMRLLIDAYNTCPSLLNRVVPLPLPPDVPIDLVPVDYVASAVATLYGRDDAVGRCFHLAAGAGRAARLRELVHLTCDFFGTPRLRFISPGPGLRFAGR